MRRRLTIALILLALWSALWTLAAGWATGTLGTALRDPALFDVAGASTGTGTGQPGDLRASGYPFHLRLDLADLQARHAASDIAVALREARLETALWNPWQIDATLSALRLTGTEARPFQLDLDSASGLLRLQPGLALGLKVADLRAGRLQLDPAPLPPITAESLTAALRHLAGARYRLDLALGPLRPGLRNGAAAGTPPLPEGPGPGLDSARIEAEIALAAPIDRQALGAPPDLRGLVLTGLELVRGTARLTGQGTLSPDPEGRAEGQITLEITGAQTLLQGALDLGWLTPDETQRLARGLTAMADPATPDRLRLTLRLQGGRIWLGLLPLGAAPRLAPPPAG